MVEKSIWDDKDSGWNQDYFEKFYVVVDNLNNLAHKLETEKEKRSFRITTVIDELKQASIKLRNLSEKYELDLDNEVHDPDDYDYEQYDEDGYVTEEDE